MTEKPPVETFIRWLWQVVFFSVTFTLCAALQERGLLDARRPFTPGTILTLSFFVPTFLHLRIKMRQIDRPRRWLILAFLLAGLYAQTRLAAPPGMLMQTVRALAVPVAALCVVWWLGRSRRIS